MRRERLICPAKNSNTVIRHNLQIQKTPPERGFLQLIQQLSANEVDVLQLRFVRVTLYVLSFNFDFFTVNNDGQNFAVEFSFSLHVHDFVVIQLDSQRRFFATVDDCRELVSGTQAAARTLTRSLRTSALIVNISFSLKLILLQATQQQVSDLLCVCKSGRDSILNRLIHQSKLPLTA